ncbi:IclR family transcriptional regulator [Pseudonocardia sp. HH130630-07]|uniref:IclR family transcriptional regulator n=1 Tax=Pseudonocardia sp. HH130630-07 TaxID=1690815 RepID=UPI00081530CA|nr:IclR family transcriptional regulator [Pseudonocardia sp. HH130630-07]ANY10456.1 IclR family transcriptional regulator [Pseudonocardia sp. HH130630-07]
MGSSTSPAVGRALDVLLHLASRPGPVPGAALVRELDLPRSSAYHLLTVLVERGFVLHYPEQRAYGLGVAAFEIGSAFLRQGPLERLGRPVARRLATRTGEIAHLGVLHGADSLYLVKERPARQAFPVSLVTEVGVRLPASLTANGRSILAHLPSAQVRALFPAALVRRTAHGPATLPGLRRLLRSEHARGWSLEDGMITDGMQSVGACAFDHTGAPVAAFSVTRRADRARTSAEELATAVRGAARDLTGRLSGRAPDGWFDRSPAPGVTPAG